MRKHHPKNERIKRRYLAYLQEAKRLSASSADQAASAIAAFEGSTRWKDFALFHIEQARSFKSRIAAQTNSETGKPLAKATIHSRLMALRAFFQWLSGQSGYKKISYSDADYFNPSANDSRIATAKREKPAPSVEQIRHVVASILIDNDIDRRDRAVIAFALLSGARDDAIASLALRHVDPAARTVFQDARSVRTKNRKTFTSWFFPVGDDIELIVVEWIAFLKSDLLFGPDDPLFPATLVMRNSEGLFAPAGLDRKFWKSADAIRRIFRQQFEMAGLRYFKPHSFRTTLARLGSTICPTQEAWSAWCENLGHEDAITTFRSYANVPSHRRGEIFEALHRPAPKNDANGAPDSETIQRVLDHLRKSAA
ncbi:MAG: site-specific integrase [Mesorhizobium sp.]|nr:MAG: site-specific integrase [Mesorhizobium sp.]